MSFDDLLPKFAVQEAAIGVHPNLFSKSLSGPLSNTQQLIYKLADSGQGLLVVRRTLNSFPQVIATLSKQGV